MPTPTIDLSLPTGDDIPIEERDGAEVSGLTLFGREAAPEGIKIGNPAFDITPHRYVTAIITENGVVYPPFDVNLKRAVNGEQVS